MSTGAISRLEQSIDKSVAGSISISRNGMAIESMSQAMEFAKLMALMREALPKHCRDNAGICLALAIQAYDWGMNPIAVASKSYVVNDRLCYEAALYHSVLCRRAPIAGRVSMEFSGEGNKRRCRVFAELSDGTGIVDYLSPEFGSIQPKNSPLWKNDPDQQLFYSSVRAFARRHFPDVMLGIYTVDEMQDAHESLTTIMNDTRSKSDRLADRLITPVATVGESKPVIATTEKPVEQTVETHNANWFMDAIEHAGSAAEVDALVADLRVAHDSQFVLQDEFETLSKLLHDAYERTK